MVEKQDDFEQFQPKSLQLFQIQNNLFISQFFQIWQHFSKKPSQQKVKNKKTGNDGKKHPPFIACSAEALYGSCWKLCCFFKLADLYPKDDKL